MKEPLIQNSFRLKECRVSNLTFSFDEEKIHLEESANTISIDINHTSGFSETPSRFFKVIFNVKVFSNAVLNLSLQHNSVFETKEIINDDFKVSPFVQINAPAIAFPYVRSFVTLLTVNAGLKPLFLPTYNFEKEDSKMKD